MAPIRVTRITLHVNIVPAGNRKSYGLTLIVVMMSSTETDRRWCFIIIRMCMCEHIQGKHNDRVTLNVPAGHSVSLVGRSGPMMFLHQLHMNYRQLERNHKHRLTTTLQNVNISDTQCDLNLVWICYSVQIWIILISLSSRSTGPGSHS